MGDVRYTVEYDHHLGLYRWQIVAGQQLLPWPVVSARGAPRVVALGGRTGLPILLRGLKAAMFPPGEPWTSARDQDRLTAIVPPRHNGSSETGVRRADPGLGPDYFPGEGERGGAVDAIEAADLIVLGPGKLYASLIAILVVKEIAAAIGRAHAPVVLVMNLMTEPGQTDGYTATDHVLAIRRHAPEIPIHGVLFNTASIPSELMERSAVDGGTPVRVEVESLRAQSHRLVGRDLLGSSPLVRHDPRKLARAVLEFASA